MSMVTFNRKSLLKVFFYFFSFYINDVSKIFNRGDKPKTCDVEMVHRNENKILFYANSRDAQYIGAISVLADKCLF